MKKLTFALIGCGRISKNHISAITDNKDFFTPVAFVDVIKDRADKTLIPGVKAYTDYNKMLEELKPDVVAISTESGYHADIACDCLKAGGHVIIEKPMALSVADCDRIIEYSKKYNKKVGVCFQNRFNEPIQKLRSAIEEEKFGRLYHGQISIRWNRNLDYYEQASWRCTWAQDGGALMNQCSHGIDLMQWMLGGKVKSVYGVLRKFNSPREAEDFGSAIVEFDNGAVGIIEGSVDVYPKNLEEKLSIFGQKGTVVVGGLAVNHMETWKFEGEELSSSDRVDPPTVYGFGHTSLYKDFYEAVVYDKKPYINAEDGKTAVELILAIYKSMKEGKRIQMPMEFNTLEMKDVNLK
jgi:UDP-N-acetyl-2-amino-2-deoxyglucuronate dehydrogenase